MRFGCSRLYKVNAVIRTRHWVFTAWSSSYKWKSEDPAARLACLFHVRGLFQCTVHLHSNIFGRFAAHRKARTLMKRIKAYLQQPTEYGVVVTTAATTLEPFPQNVHYYMYFAGQ